MVVAAMKHMASNFAKLDKFEGVNFRRWQKKMHFLLSNMSVVYMLTTHIPGDGDDATVEQLRKRANWDNDDHVCRGLILNGIFTQHKINRDEAIQVSCIIDKLPHFQKDFTHTLKHSKEELTLVELGSHLRIEESLRTHDSDKSNGNNVVGPQLNIVNDNITLAFMSTSKLNDSILWHARLGHVHFKRMQDMSKDGLILAFDMDIEKCKTYMMIKITKKSFQNVKRETKVLELIHGDLCDLHATPSLRNKKYFVTFIDVASRIPNKRNMIIPYELWTKRKPNLNYLRVWGCRAVVRLPNPKIKTLDKRGIECIFVGYAEHSKAFRFFVIEPNQLVSINSISESRNAIFNENRLSSVPIPSLNIPKGTKDIGGLVFPEKSLKRTRDGVSDQHSYCFKVEDDPKTFDEAIKSQDVTFWKKAINNEMDSIMGNNTWGFRQKSGIDYFDTYALVARISTIRLLIAMASIQNLIIHQMDVKTAFLNGELDKEIDMTKDFLSSRISMKDMREADVILVSTSMDTSEKLMPNNGQAVSQLEYFRISNTEDNSSTSGWVFLLGGAAGKEPKWLRNLNLKIPLLSKPIAPITMGILDT
ncbi:zinc finger, CCHC-type containing protein [Tanacetum coccineum]|uniref:Zinc finger, CCHC-type containing protein n=1 Tax=Tanacetum coccineum TaxID=301880 RepID=A0ABQ4Z7M7_9ASTR